MDTLTHIALGAVIGEAIGGRKLGRKAMVLGAATQIFPDVDVIAALWLSPAENLVAHRGITHSLLFSALSMFLFAFLAQKRFRKESIATRFWWIFFGTQIGVHIFIDTFNAYGIGLLEPFSAFRLSFHSLYVVDPLFILWLLISASALIVSKKSTYPIRLRWALLSLGACSVYLLVSLAHKSFINREVKRALHTEQIDYQDFITTPTPFNSLLWYVVIKGTDGYYTGYRSVFDNSTSLTLRHFEQNTPLVTNTSLPEVTKKLIELSQDYYVYSYQQDTLRINLMMFGQAAGWTNPKAPFVLACDLLPEETTLALLQEGRASEMNVAALSALRYRIFNEAHP